MQKTTSSHHRQEIRAARPVCATRALESLECRRMLSAATDYVAGELLVSFRPGVSQSDIAQFYAQHGFSEREALDRQVRGNAARLKLVSVPAAKTIQLIPALERDPRVAYAEPNYLAKDVLAATTPTDTHYPLQWGLHNIGQWSSTPDADVDAPEAWKITTGSPDVLVAVIDNGTDYNHPDLAANIWTNPFETAGDGIDNDGNGYVDDIHGINTVIDTGDPMADPLGIKAAHGTGVAGILGAAPFNEGVVGLAWRVGIVPIRAISSADTIKISDAVQAFQYVNYLKHVQGQNIVVTNNSWLEDSMAWSQSQALRDAITGVDQPGMSQILHIAAAGNEDRSNDVLPFFPASYDLDNIISVAATGWDDSYTDFSNYGATSVDLAAPGVTIATLGVNGRYDYIAIGTSQAAPLVTGAAALVWSAFPNLTAAQVRQRILGSVDPIGHIGNNSAKPTVTNGRLNVAKALAGAPTAGDTRAPAAIGSLTIASTTFQSQTLAWTATGDDVAAGRASFYDIRYSTSPITNGNWDTATRAVGEPGPKPAGAAESFTVAGLDPSTTYYFAVRARDDMGNESGISNVAQATTAPAAILFSDDIESGANGWSASGLWHLSTSRAGSPTTAWYYGLEATHSYDTGIANSGTLTSPIIDLRYTSQPVLIYREWREMEDVTFLDSAKVQVSDNGNTWETLYQSEISTAIDPLNWQPTAAEVGWNLNLRSRYSESQWVSRGVDLSSFAGKTVRIRFVFDTVDASHNDFEGWYVDDLNVVAAASPPPLGGMEDRTSSTSRIAPAHRPAECLLCFDSLVLEDEFASFA